MTRLTVGLAAGVVVLGAGLTAGLVRATGPAAKPRAVVVYHVAAEQPAVVGAGVGGPPLAAYKEFQVSLLTNRKTLAEVLKDPRVKNLLPAPPADAVEWLRDRVTVDPRGASEFMSVAVEADKPEEALELVAAISKAYLDASYQHDNRRRLARRTTLEREYKAARDQVEEGQAHIDGIARRLGSKDGAVLALIDRFRVSKLEESVSKVAALRDELTAAQATLAAAKGQAKWLALRPAVMAVTGVPWAATLGPDPKVASSDAAQEEVDRLVREMSKAEGKIKQLEKELEERNRYKIDLETHQRQIALKEQTANLLAGHIEAMRLEAGVPPRVTVAEDPSIQRAPRGQDPIPPRASAAEPRAAPAGAAGPGVWAWAGPALGSLLGAFVGAAVAVRLVRPAAAARAGSSAGTS
jgi:hypothetical protein